jgi:hypothetical protein
MLRSSEQIQYVLGGSKGRLLHEAPREAGYPEPVVQEWLELVPRTGMDARFTEASRPSARIKDQKAYQRLQALSS